MSNTTELGKVMLRLELSWGCDKECQQAGAELGQAGIGLNFRLIPVQLGVGGWCHNDIK